MIIVRNYGRMLAALAASMIAACGGGGGSEPVAGIDRGGVTIAQGPISGFGSVILNGVRYSTSGATITVDDQPGTESDLRVGQVVRVEGTVDAGGTTGTARRHDWWYSARSCGSAPTLRSTTRSCRAGSRACRPANASR
jgi:hypothetical protein